MGILSRFADIISANINDLLDKAEDPAKMVDQCLRDMMEDLAEVKKETAAVMAEESRCKRLVDENDKESARFEELAKRALMAGNENDARVLLAKKQEIENAGAALETAYAAAHENAVRMRQLHDKLVADISELNNRKAAIKAKVSVAKAQEKVNQFVSRADKAEGAMAAFARMEAKADQMLDEATARAELELGADDSIDALEEKYRLGDSSASVDAELAAMKAKLGL
ncbi:MAG: PspA/IM30 family protein [Clostridia bacterium]|nr:PspA/IM30 family protein [Clostridia bacterium]